MKIMNLKDYGRKFAGKRCKFCNAKLPTVARCYPHPRGWVVDGYKERQWVYVICRKCGYQWSLVKLQQLK